VIQDINYPVAKYLQNFLSLTLKIFGL